MKKIIGIIGGVGPLSTADFFEKIITLTDADCDQDHLHIIVDNNPSVPDRTNAVLHNGESPLASLLRSASFLKAAGAEILAMPCCTAHIFSNELPNNDEIQFVDMLRETIQVLKQHEITLVGLLATDGLIHSGHFTKMLSDAGITPLLPNGEEQQAVTDMIYHTVKAGRWERDNSDFCNAAQQLINRGAQVLILGCTELPLAFSHYDIKLPYIDPTKVLAAAVIKAAGGKLKPNASLISR